MSSLMIALTTMMMTTAVSRVSAAQPDAFLLASERGCDTLFVHDAVRQKKCLALQKKSPLVWII
jgi:hypothetical protein